MALPPTTIESKRARLEEQLALFDLLIALSDERVAGQRILAQQSGLGGNGLAEALIKLTIMESSIALRTAERKRLLEALLNLQG